MSDDHSRIISRRDLLKGAAVTGAALAGLKPGATNLEGVTTLEGGAATTLEGGADLQVGQHRYENLTAFEGEMLDAIVARLIPTDANGPGATEARAAHYIDRALGGALAESREAYRIGFAAFDRYCRMSRGKPFVELSPTDQDSVLIDVETGAATGSGAGFTASSAAFFAMVKAHTWQGTFGDPYYGGNASFVGWNLIGYPGIRTVVTAADQQRLERSELKPMRRSAYDSGMFNKATSQRGVNSPRGNNAH